MKHFRKSLMFFFKNNWQLKLISLLLSIVIWFLICEYVDPDTDVTVPNIPISIDFEGSLPEAEGLVMMTEIDTTVSVRVRGSRDAIAMMDEAAITADVDLKNVSHIGEYDLDVRVSLGNSNLEIVSQSVKTVKVKFDKKVTIPVTLRTEKLKIDSVPEGYTLKEKLGNQNIEVTGPKELVETVKEAVVTVNHEFKDTSEQDYEFDLVDFNGNIIDSKLLSTDIDKVHIRYQVLRMKEDVPFEVNVINSIGGDVTSLCTVECSPADFTLIGGNDALESYNTHVLGTIDLSEVTEKEYVVTFPVKLPNENIENPENVTEVTVTVRFNETVTSTKLNVKKIEVVNVPDGTTITIPDKVRRNGLDIKVRGLPEAIAELKTDDVKVIVDAGNKSFVNGRNELVIRVEFPKDSGVCAIGPYLLYVNVKINK